MVRIGSIVLRVDDLERQTAFWMATLDYVPRTPNYVILADPEGNRFCVMDTGR